MKVGVLSDSHDHLDRLALAVQHLRDREVELVLHAGDFIAPFTVPVLHRVGVPIRAVFGNNDGERIGLKARFDALGHQLSERPQAYEFSGKRFLLLHEPVALEALEGSPHYDLVVYGHTHQLDIRHTASGALLLNPGEVCGWVTGQAHCCVVDLSTRQVEVIALT